MGREANERFKELRDLYEKWGAKAAQLRRVNEKAATLQPRGDLTPSLLRRLSRWMEQIAGLEAKERDIVSEIADIEDRHKDLRKKGALRRAKPKEEEPQPEGRDQKKRNLWFWLLLLWMMRSKRKPNALR